jgi:hypothetical protein
LLNPTNAGSPVFADVANSAVQVAPGAKAQTITGGTQIDAGYFASAQPASDIPQSEAALGAKIDGTRDVLVLAVTPITNNINVQGSITWREQV